MPIPGNFLSATTEMIDPNTSGWTTLLNCTLSLGTGGRNGDGTLRLTAAAAGEMRARTVTAYPVMAGETYFTLADAASATQPERIGIRWLDAAGAEISITWSLATAAASSSWHRISVAGAAPAEATSAQVVVSATAAAGGTHAFENIYLGLPIRFVGNLFGFNTEGAEISGDAWVAETNSTVARSVPAISWPADFYLGGGHVIAMTVTAAGDASMVAAERPMAESGQEYRAYAYLNPPTSTATCWVELRWYDADDVQLGAVRATLGQTTTGWMRQYVSGIAPAGTATCGIAAGITSASAGQILRTDGVVMAIAPELQAGTVVPYADGSFEQGLAGWTVVSGPATIARSAWDNTAPDGAHYLVVTSATAATTVIRSALFPLGEDLGLGWRWQVYAQVAAGGWDLGRSVRWYDDTGTEVGDAIHIPTPVPTPELWILTNSGDPPAGATQAAIEYTLTATAPTSTLWLDRVAMWQALPIISAEPDAARGRIVLTLRELTVGQLITVWRVGADGQRTLVRGPGGLYERMPIESDLLVIEDYEAPLGVPVTYQVETVTAGGGSPPGFRESQSVTLDSGDPGECWLKDPANPQRNMCLVVQDGGAPDWQRPARGAEYVVRGRRNPVILSDVRGGLVGDLAVWTRSDDEREALHLLLNSSNTLLWQTAPGYGIDQLYVTVGDITEARISSRGTEPWRSWTLPLTQVDMPTTGVNGSAGRTWRDVLTEFAAWQTVLDTYTTWEDLLLDRRRG